MRSLIKIIGVAILALILFPLSVSAASLAPQVAVWIPYWKKASGTPEIIQHIGKVNEISPFAYEVEDDGTIGDTMKLAALPWTDLLSLATTSKVKVIPSILWIHGDAIHAVLSDAKKRKAHVDDILSMVERNNFSGIDIDYENKMSKTKTYFSSFLKELAIGLHAKKKLLICTIEPRTPASSLYKVLPTHPIERANDYLVINTYCDEVRLMTYDQGIVDLKLNKSKGDGVFYAPVADTQWVSKVAAETIKTISKKKLFLGVATYGYEYRVDTSSSSAPVYSRLRAISHPDALALAAQVGARTYRNISGEISFAYTKDGSPRFVTWSDGLAVAEKVKLAKKLGLKGIAIFKADGQADPVMWELLK